MTLLTEMRDTVGLVMMEQGKDISKFTDADFQAAIDVIQQAKDAGQIKGFTGNEYTDGLAKGDIAACVAWTGDVVQLQFADPNIQYTLPEKGFTLWSDNFVIPALAKHKKNAEKLIDYYYDPAVMAQVEAYVNYIAPVAGTKEELVKIDPELGRQPAHRPAAGRAGPGPGVPRPHARPRRRSTPRCTRRSRRADGGHGQGRPLAGRAHEVVRVVHGGAAARPHHRGRARSSPCSVRRAAARRRRCG